MNWIGFGIGVAAITFFIWVIVEGRKECQRMGWQPKK